jgi:hypothetical protein
MSEDKVDSFAEMMLSVPSSRRQAREKRTQKERRAQLTERQRNRGGVRTTQINFRCSPAFRVLARGMAKHLDASIADVMEEALEKLAKDKGYYKAEGNGG